MDINGDLLMNTLMIDTRQQAGKHDLKHKYFEDHGIPTLRSKLPVGDYTWMQDMSVVIDSKNSILELCSDICGKDHDRFRRECNLAKDNGIKLIVLVENIGGEIRHSGVFNETITDLSELHTWKNPRSFIFANGKQKYPQATRGITLQKCCYTMQNRYGVRFIFCTPEDAGAKIIELLTKDNVNER